MIGVRDRTGKANTTEARPRSPNQPMKATAVQPSRLPGSATVTGIMRGQVHDREAGALPVGPDLTWVKNLNG